MSEDAGAGRLSIEVTGDTTGFARGLQARIDAQTRNVRARIDAQIDARQLQRQAQVAARAVTGVTVTVGVRVDTTGMQRQVREAARRIEASVGRVNVGVNVDTTGMHTQVRTAMRRVEQTVGRIRVQVDTTALQASLRGVRGGVSAPARVDTAELLRDLRTAMAAAQAYATANPITVGVRAAPFTLPNFGNLNLSLPGIGGMFRSLSGIALLLPVIEGGLAAIVNVGGGLVAVAGGLTAIAAAAGQAAAAVAIVPAGIAALAQGIGTAVAGFRGIGDAIKATGEAETTAAADTGAAARAREAAQRRVAQAVRGVADAQDAVADAAANATRVQQDGIERVADAERRHVDAMGASERARDRLNDAYRTARERLEDLQFTLRGAALSERDAVLGLERAQERLANLRDTGTYVAPIDMREAELAVDQALLRLDEVREANADLAVESAQQITAGVEGAAEVVAARADIVDAVQAEQDAERDLARTRRDTARANADAQAAIADAQQGVLDAQADLLAAQRDLVTGAGAVTAAATKAADAMANLSPAGRAFVLFMRGEFLPMLERVRREAQERLLPGVQDGLTSILRLEGPLTRMVGGTADVLGGLFRTLGTTITTPQWLTDLDTIGRQNASALGIFGQAAINLLQPLRDIIVVVGEPGGLMERFGQWTTGLTAAWGASVALRRESGELATELRTAGDVIAQWGRIVENIWTGLGNILTAARPAGQALTDSFEGATGRFATWSQDNAAQIGAWFDAIRPTVETTGRILTDFAGALARIAAHPAVNDTLVLIETRLGPALGRFADALQDSGSGEQFVLLLTEIVDLLASLVETGLMRDALELLTDIVGVIGDFADTEYGGEIIAGFILLAGVAGPLGAVAGAIASIASAVARIARSRGVTAILRALGGTRVGAAVAGGARAAAGAVAGAAGAAGGAARAAGRGAARGGLVGAAAGVTGYVAGEAISDDRGGARDVAGGAVSGAATGAGIGALAGSVVPVVGTAIGAAVGGTVGAGVGAVQGNGGLDKTRQDINKWSTETNASIDAWIARTRTSLSVWADDANTSIDGWIARTRSSLRSWADDRNDGINNWLTRTRESIGTWAENTNGRIDRWVSNTRDGLRGWSTNANESIDTWITRTRENIGGWATTTNGRIDTWIANTRTGIGEWSSRTNETINGWVNRTTENITTWATTTTTRVAGWANEQRAAFDRWREETTLRAGQMRDNVIARVQDMAARGGTAFQGFRDNAVARMGEARDQVRDRLISIADRFGITVSDIETAWNRLKSVASAPVGFVVNTVYNQGLRRVFNAVAGIIPGAPQLPEVTYTPQFAAGGVLPGYTPGRDVHTFTSPTGGRLALSGGEAVMRPEFTAAVGADWVHGANRAARSGRRAVSRFIGGFAGGGIIDRLADLGGKAVSFGGRVVDSITGRVVGAADAVREGVTDIGGKVAGFALGTLRSAAEAVLNPIRSRLANEFAPVGFGAMAQAAGGNLIERALGFLAKKDTEATVMTGGGFGKAGAWPPAVMGRVSANTAAAVAYIREAFGLSSIGTLGNRPNKSDHPMGKALDAMIPGWNTGAGRAKGTEVASWFVNNAARFGTKYVIWNDQINTGGGWRGYTHPNGPTSNPTLRHLDHVHVSFLGDGATVKPTRGGTMAVLGEGGRAEAVVDEGLLNRRLAEMDDLRDLVTRFIESNTGPPVVVYPQPRQSEWEIGMAAAKTLEWSRRY